MNFKVDLNAFSSTDNIYLPIYCFYIQEAMAFQTRIAFVDLPSIFYICAAKVLLHNFRCTIAIEAPV